MVGGPQGSVLGPKTYMVISYTKDLFDEMDNNSFCYADDATPLAIITSHN